MCNSRHFASEKARRKDDLRGWFMLLKKKRHKMTAWGIMGDLLLSSLNKLERRLLFLFGGSGIFLAIHTERHSQLFYMFYWSSFMCGTGENLCYWLMLNSVYLHLFVYVQLFLPLFFKVFFSDCSSPFHSSIQLNCCWHPTFKQRAKGGKVPDDKSQWEC